MALFEGTRSKDRNLDCTPSQTLIATNDENAATDKSNCRVSTTQANIPESMTNEQVSRNTSPSILDSSDEYLGPPPKSVEEGGKDHLSAGQAEQTPEEKAMQSLRWQLATDAIRKYPIFRDRFAASSPESDQCPWFKPSVEELVARYSSNLPSPALLKRSSTEGKKIGMVLWFASMVYGAVHVAACNYYFPSYAETILWRFSALFITASGLLWLLINGLAHKSAFLNRFWGRFIKMRSSWPSYVLIGSISTLCGAAYVVNRLYLVIEAFVSIRQLPLGAYATPDWIQTIPHL